MVDVKDKIMTLHELTVRLAAGKVPAGDECIWKGKGVVRADCGTFISYKYEKESIFLPYRVTEVIVEVCTEPLPRSAAEHW